MGSEGTNMESIFSYRKNKKIYHFMTLVIFIHLFIGFAIKVVLSPSVAIVCGLAWSIFWMGYVSEDDVFKKGFRNALIAGPLGWILYLPGFHLKSLKGEPHAPLFWRLGTKISKYILRSLVAIVEYIMAYTASIVFDIDTK